VSVRRVTIVTMWRCKRTFRINVNMSYARVVIARVGTVIDS